MGGESDLDPAILATATAEKIFRTTGSTADAIILAALEFVARHKDAEIAKLRAEVEAERFKRAGAESAYELLSIQSASVVRELESTERALSAARAALDKTVERLNSAKGAMVANPRDWNADRRDAWLWAVVVGWGNAFDDVARKHGFDDGDVERLRAMGCDARRSAEAQPKPVRCPECDGTGRRVKYHGGSINDPNVIGLAMESLPCRCQAEARP